jgi:mRNA interferase RelE/StbE
MTQDQRYLLKVADETVALVRGLHPEIKTVIKSALKTIAEDPYAGKSLKDDLKGLRSYRVKRYRIIYRVLPAKKQLKIIAIGPRKNIYEDTFRLIQDPTPYPPISATHRLLPNGL